MAWTNISKTVGSLLTAADINNLQANFTALAQQLTGAPAITKVTLDDGDAANPTLRFGSDTNTGIFRAGTDIIAIATASTERLRIDSAGNVGIGTTPSTVLDVNGTGNTDIGILRLRSSTGDSSGISLFYSASPNANARAYQLACNYTAFGDFQILQSASNATNPTNPVFTINKDGQVGIGTNSPSSNLDIESSAGVQIGLYANDGASGRLYAIQSRTDGKFQINDDTAGSARLVIDSAGQVGIGTSTINAKLSIAGDDAFSGLILRDNTHPANMLEIICAEYGGTDSRSILKALNSSSFTVETSGTEKFRVFTDNFVKLTAYDTGSGTTGRVLSIGHNNNATPAAGCIEFFDKGGTAYYLWVDDSGVLRIHTSAPTNANDTAGTVVGTQT